MEGASSPLSPVEEFFVGSAAAARSQALLRAFKISYVINAAQEEANPFPGQVKYLRVSLPNGPRVCHHLSETLDSMESFIAEAKNSKSRVLLHCSMGQIRAPTLAALLLVHRGRSPSEAAAYVRRRRPISDPDEGILRVLHKYQLKKRKEAEDRERTVEESMSRAREREREDDPADDVPHRKRNAKSPSRAQAV